MKYPRHLSALNQWNLLYTMFFLITLNQEAIIFGMGGVVNHFFFSKTCIAWSWLKFFFYLVLGLPVPSKNTRTNTWIKPLIAAQARSFVQVGEEGWSQLPPSCATRISCVLAVHGIVCRLMYYLIKTLNFIGDIVSCFLFVLIAFRYNDVRIMWHIVKVEF